jgi:hypothetical protein
MENNQSEMDSVFAEIEKHLLSMTVTKNNPDFVFPTILALSEYVFIDDRYRKPGEKIDSNRWYQRVLASKKDYRFIKPSSKEHKALKKLLDDGHTVLIIYKKGFLFERFVKRLPAERLSRHIGTEYFLVSAPAPSIHEKVDRMVAKLKKKHEDKMRDSGPGAAGGNGNSKRT